MKRLLILGALLLWSAVVPAGVIKTIQAGATDQSVTIKIIDSTDGTPETGVVFNTSGIDLEYWRHGANAVTDITEVTQTVNGAHTDGGFVSVGHGIYRLDLPDAAVAAGVTAVEIQGTVTGMIVIGGTVQLSTDTPQTGDSFARLGAPVGASFSADLQVVDANVDDIETDTADMQPKLGTFPNLGAGATLAGNLEDMRDNGTAAFDRATDSLQAVRDSMGTAQTGDAYARLGAPAGASVSADIAAVKVDTAATLVDTGTSGVLISSGTGSGQLSITSGVALANTVQVSGDSAVADRWEAILDGTCGSYPELGITRGVGCTAQAYTAGTPSITLDASAAFGDNTLEGATILICGSTQGYCQPATAVSNVGSTDVVTLREALPVAATGTITYTIFGTATGGGDVNVTTIEGTDATTVLGTAQTGDAYARLGAPAGASVSADIAAVKSDSAAILVDTGTTLQAEVDGIQADTEDLQTRVPAALVSGRIDASVGAMASNVMTAAAAAADLTTELQTGLATAAAIEQTARADAAIVNCEVNTANFAGSTTTVACILTDRADSPITAASNDLEGRELLILSGAQIYEGRFITDTTWDGANSELRLTLSRALPGTLADAVTAIIR